MITVESKHELIQLLLCEELLTKRIDALNNFCEGLNYFGLVDMLKTAPGLGEGLFMLKGANGVSAEELLNCFDLKQPTKPEELKAFNHLQTL